MSTKEKLIKRFKSKPSDFTFEEMVRLFAALGFETDNKGSTSGSRLEFINQDKKLSYNIHKPHPSNNIKSYVIKQTLQYLIDNQLITK